MWDGKSAPDVDSAELTFLGFWLYRLLITGGGRSLLDAVVAGVIAYVAAYLVYQWRPRTTLPAEPAEP